MPERLDALVRTTLADITPVDVTQLARRARRRRRTRRGALVGGMASLVLVLVALLVVPHRGEESQHVVTSPDEGVSYVLDRDPVGTWTQGANPPFAPRAEAFSDTLSDGRVLVWGGRGAEVPPISDGITGTTLDQATAEEYSDGGIYDADTDTWEPIPPPTDGQTYHSALLEDDHLVVTGDAGQQNVRAAVYDVTAASWTIAPQIALNKDVEAITAWNGDTLVFIETGPLMSPTPGSAAPTPRTYHWTRGDEQWVEGAAFPLTPRHSSGADSDGDLLAIWGGTSTTLSGPTPELPTGLDTGLLGDGAIYDIAADSWTILAPAPVEAATWPAALWDGGRLIVGGGEDGEDHALTASHRHTPAAFDPATSEWETLPDAPRISFDGTERVGIPAGPLVQYDGGPPAFIVAADIGDSSGMHPWFLHEGAWEQAPYVTLHGNPAGTIVSSTDWQGGNPEEAPFELAVRESAGHWQLATQAPFTNRSDPAVVTSEGRIVVVGGLEHSSMEPAATAWVFDPNG